MPSWLGYLLAFGAVVVFTPLLGWFASKHGRRIKGGVAMASLMLGMGALFDPPQKAAAEAEEALVKGAQGSGDPPDPEIVPTHSSDG